MNKTKIKNEVKFKKSKIKSRDTKHTSDRQKSFPTAEDEELDKRIHYRMLGIYR